MQTHCENCGDIYPPGKNYCYDAKCTAKQRKTEAALVDGKMYITENGEPSKVINYEGER